jgi:dTDP-4-amino-4,6-dideoxygalactose transaminase
MKFNIKYYGLDRFVQKNKELISEISSNAIRNGIFINGDETKNLELKLAERCNRKYAITVGSGTDALFFALQALNINKGDEILVPALSFIATATAISRTGAKPVFVDIHSTNGLMDFEDAKAKITTKTKALLFVDLYGNMPYIAKVREFVKTHNLLLIEDAAQAFGSIRDKQAAGSMGDISIVSFDPSKPIGAFGTGGAVLTDIQSIANFCIAARINGYNLSTLSYDQFGINSRISESQAALIHWQLSHFDESLNARKKLADLYIQKLNGLPLEILVKEQQDYTGNWHKFVISTTNRDDLKAYLFSQGIETRIHYDKCMYQHPILNSFATKCKHAENLTGKLLSLPFYPELKANEIDYICDKINTFYS